MRTNHGEYGIAEQQAADLICFLLGHVALLKQDLPTAFAAYAPLISRVEQTEAAGFLWPKLTLGMLFRDLALISMHEGNPQRAVRFCAAEISVALFGERTLCRNEGKKKIIAAEKSS